MIDKETKREIRKRSRQEVWGSKKDVAAYIVSLFISSLLASLITLLLKRRKQNETTNHKARVSSFH